MPSKLFSGWVHIGAQILEAGVGHQGDHRGTRPQRWATRIAAMTLAPDDVPAKSASSRASRLAIAFASSVFTAWISSASAGSQSGGV